ncbi:MAG TPA: hypothetical protein VJ933_10945, partial [Phaeodactylibacter sp.]|nr:hypothetical protein [Phaeodactylibacter sp.]
MPSSKSLVFILCLFCTSGFAQLADWMVDETYNGLDWTAFVEQIEQAHPVRIFYKTADVSAFQPPSLSSAVPLLDFLQTQLPQCKIAH